MLFNSPVYIFIFLPFVILVYFTLNRYRLVTAGKVWLVLSSLFFYGYWNTSYLLLIVSSILINFGLGSALRQSFHNRASNILVQQKYILVFGILFNLGLLGFFKYADFFIENINMVTGSHAVLLELVLPLAISFFTFQQISYLVDSYYSITDENDLLNYSLFVCFFPQLVSGPIVHHSEMMPQFRRLRGMLVNWKNLVTGCFIFIIGLFKKVVIADTFAIWATAGFDAGETLDFLDAWGASLSYTFQLYYDFSGYTDMAIGAALMLNIHLPINFYSPYKSTSIKEFWRKWHMTLSRWLRDYLYIPLGGNRKGKTRVFVNIMATFLLGGLWHGAGWTFIAWGGLHGLALSIHRLWNKAGLSMPVYAGWLCTFMFVNISWVFFRSKDMESAIQMLKSMLNFDSAYLSLKFVDQISILTHTSFHSIFSSFRETAIVSEWSLLASIMALVAVASCRNSMQIKDSMLSRNHIPSLKATLLISIMAATSFIILFSSSSKVFLYYNF